MAAGFIPYSNLRGPSSLTALEFPMAASTTINKYDVVATDSDGLLIPATNSTTAKIVGVMVGESTTTGAGEYTKVPVCTDPCQLYKAELSGNSNQNQVGTSYDLTDANTVNLSATTNKIVKVWATYGAAADNTAIVSLNKILVA